MMRSQQSQMKKFLEKSPTGSPMYNKIVSTIDKIELACKEMEEDSFGFLRGGLFDELGASSLKNSILNHLTAFTEGMSLNTMENS